MKTTGKKKEGKSGEEREKEETNMLYKCKCHVEGAERIERM